MSRRADVMAGTLGLLLVNLLVGSAFVVGTAGTAGATTVHYAGAAPGQVTCALTMDAAFSPPLTTSGGGTGISSISEGKVSGCTATTGAVTISSGTVTGSYPSGPLDCQDAFTGAAADLTVTWKGQVNGTLSVEPESTVYAAAATFSATTLTGGTATGSFAGPAGVTLNPPSASAVSAGCRGSGLKKVALTGTLTVGTPTPAPSQPVTQPTPPVSAADFPLEPLDQAPVDGDGLIPNPASPTGQPVGAPSSCAVTFSSSDGATSADVNAWIAANENTLTGLTVACLSGVFGDPIHVWSKTSVALLEIAPAPGASATLDLGTVQPADSDPNQYWSDSGGVSVVDSRSVEVYGLTVENYTYNGTGQSPAGIYVSTRSDVKATDQSVVPHLSACFLDGGSCSDVYVIDNTVRDIANSADEDNSLKADCNNQNVDAYGIAVIAGGTATSQQLQHLVIEDNTVTGTRTGQSETVTINGAVRDFLAAGNVIGDADNIGLDTIGWETGGAQANHGYVDANTVYDVDTESNAAYGRWDATTDTCEPLPENAAGLYDDGASYVWFGSNTVWNSDQGINLDVETGGKETDHLLVSENTVHQDPGISAGDPSAGGEPPGVSGASTVAGHDPYALYLDAFGKGASIKDVYVHDNTFQNESQYYLTPSDGMPVVDLGGKWSDVDVWHNTIEGMGAADRWNPLLEVDTLPVKGSTDVIDCNDYDDLSTATDTVNGNFALPDDDWLTLAGWQEHNGYGWDNDSAVGGIPASCPVASVP